MPSPSPYWQAPFVVRGGANILHKGHKVEEQRAGEDRGGGGAKAACVRLPAPVLAEVASARVQPGGAPF